MSLLIKALEQAAKDRGTGKGDAQSGAAEAPAPMEPTLEPPPPPRPLRTRMDDASEAPAPATPAAVPAPKPAPPKPVAQAAAPLGLDQPAAKAQSARSLAGLAQIDAQQQRARAAAVVQAGGGSAANAIAFLRANPVMAIGALALLVGLGFGIYVYVQVAHPGIFLRQASPKTPPPAPQAVAAPQPSAPSPEAAPSTSSSLATAPPDAPKSSALPAVPASASSVAAPNAPAGGTPIPAGNVVAVAPASDSPRTSTPDRAALPEPRRSSRTDNAQPAPAAAAPAAASAPAPAAADANAVGRERIAVSPTNTQPRLNPMLSQAYGLLQAGNIEDARTLYTKLMQAEPLNIDALLGLAYIAVQQHRSDEATRLYLRILELNPRHSLAQAALIGVMGRADPAASESRLKQLIAREPSAFLHFVLGNLYSEQSHWSQAQQSYFQAHHLEPSNPDYAYNLAIGLDHLRQSKLALNYYRRAEQLASTQGRSNFDLNHARERIRILSSGLE